PSREHAMTTQQIVNNLLRGHYESQRLDDTLSSRVLDILLKDIDSTRSYLLAADVAEFEQYRHSLDERSEEHTSELQSREHLVCRLLLEKKKILSAHNSCLSQQ